MAAFAALLAAGLLAAPVPGGVYREERPAPPPAPLVTGLPDLTRLAEVAVPAVVGVVTLQGGPPAIEDEALRDLFDRLHDGPKKGIGSGFVVNGDGWIVTNAHVVEGAERVEVDLGGGEPRLAARVVGADRETDVALLKVDAGRPLPSLPLGDSDGVAVAEWVVVIGSPFGLDHSVTVGVVSHTGRADISPVGRPGTYDFIQTDASVNPGNSGGPMLNLRGEVIGIATAVNATGQGISFAIPINMAKAVLTQLRARGRVIRSWLGVAVRDLPGRAGVEVTEVTRGGPAADAGVRPGDVILGFDGHAVKSPSRLRWYVSTAGVGREVELRFRSGERGERAVRIPLSEVPAEEEARAQAQAAGALVPGPPPPPAPRPGR